MIAYRLDKSISVEKLASDINKLLEKESRDKSNLILVVTIKETNEHIPKLPSPE